MRGHFSRLSRALGGLTLILGIASVGQDAGAQTPGGPTPNANTYSSNVKPLAVSVYGNPYTNPYMNPFAAQGNMSRTDMALYFYAAQQATMGMNTAQINPAKPGSRAGVPSVARDASTSVSAQVPGVNAMNYFQRGPSANKPAPRYYQRQSSRLPAIGH